MLALTGLLVPMFVCLVRGAKITRARHPAFQDPETALLMPDVRDCWLALVVAVVMVALRAVLVTAFEPFACRALPPAMQTSQYRVNRIATSMFKLVHFSIATVVGYWLLHDEPWFPCALGGSGDFSVFMDIVLAPPPPALRYYMLVELAYQTHSLLLVLFCKPFGGDTMDFAAHDLTSMLLIGNAYVVNYIFMSATITFLNDVCDSVQWTRAVYGDGFASQVSHCPTYAVFLLVWWYTRLEVYPRECLHLMFFVVPMEDPYVSMLSLQPANGMFALLLGLQAYWYVAQAIKGLSMLTTKSKNSSHLIVKEQKLFICDRHNQNDLEKEIKAFFDQSRRRRSLLHGLRLSS